MHNINDLYQFSQYIPPVDLSLHQYLLLASDPILVHSGDIGQAEKIIPQIDEILKGISLKYIFVSHFESDECGGINLFVKKFPEIKVICSEITSRQLLGFGIKGNILPQKDNDIIVGDNYTLKFITYPSEIHLQDGLIMYEEARKVLFSSDLMFRFGNTHGKLIENKWKAEIETIDIGRIPNIDKINELKKKLFEIKPNFIAVGHGPCIIIQ